MKTRGVIAVALLAVMSFSLAGCASSKPRVDSTADLSYAKTIHKLYIVAELPRTPQGEVLYWQGQSTAVDLTDQERRLKLYKTYADEMEMQFQALGIEARCEVLTGLELDDSSTGAKAVAFAPDAVLVIDCVSVQLVNGGFVGASYDVSLLDFPTEKRVWRGKFGIADLYSVYAANLAKRIFTVVMAGLEQDKMNVLGTIEK